VSDFVDLRPNGIITLPLTSSLTITLRRPNLGEFRDMREQFDELADATNDALSEIAIRVDEAAEMTREQQLEKRQETRVWRRQVTSELEGKRLDWLRMVCERLGDKRLPDDVNELPAWITDPGLAASMTRHWVNHPGPPSGAR